MWQVIQCAVQGRGHIKEGIPCQDKTFSLNKNNTTIISLADGAGSARLSHYGAERITRYICEDLAENFDDYYVEEDGANVKKNLVAKIIAQLDDLSKDLGCEIKELASTLMFVAIKERKFIIAHIGDGVVGYLKDDELKIASQPENGEFTNTTVFTTSEDSLLTMKLIKGNVEKIHGFVLMSDGTETSLYNKKEKKLAEVLKKIMSLCIVVSSERVEEQLKNSFETTIKQATTDDCSIVFMVNDKESFKGYRKLSNTQKKKMLDLKQSVSKKRLKRYDIILENLEEEKSIRAISRIIHLKTKYTQTHIDRLLKLNFVEKKGIYYHTILIL